MISKSNTTTQVWGFFSFKLNESNMDKPLFESGGNKKRQHNKHIHLTSLLHHQRNIWQTVKECTTLSYTSEPECSIFIKVQFYLLRHKTFLVFLWLCGVLYLSGFFFSEIMSIYCIWLHFYSSAIFANNPVDGSFYFVYCFVCFI